MLMNAKKKLSADKKNKLPRKETATLQHVLADIGALEEAIAELKVYADKGFAIIGELPVDGSQKLSKAKVLVREYADNLWRSARRAQDRLERLS